MERTALSAGASPDIFDMDGLSGALTYGGGGVKYTQFCLQNPYLHQLAY